MSQINIPINTINDNQRNKTENELMTDDLRNKLFYVIRAGLGQVLEPQTISEFECRELICIGARQSINSIIYRGLNNSGAPADVTKECDYERLNDTKRYILQNDALNKIIAILDEEHIPYIPLKGAVIRKLYPEPELRTSSDIDLLVNENTLRKAVEAIEHATDFKTMRKSYHDISLINSQIHLELHFTIKENIKNIDRLLSCAWEYASPANDGSSRYDFTPEFLIFHVIAHMYYHFTHGGLGIRTFLDLWLLRNKTDFNEIKVRQMCAECEILKFYEECCNLSEIWFGSGKHTETTKMLEDFCLCGGVFGSAQFKNAGRQRHNRGWKYILSRVFPPAYQVKEFYRDENGKEHILIYYYFKRLLSWCGRRKELTKQMQAVLSSDTEYLNSTYELFRRLDL